MPKTEMLINYVPGEECRIAIVRDDRLEEFYQERASAESHVGNIYKGRVVNVEPSIQAAFIDFGLERNGFLHISDLHPMYFPGKDREEFEKVGSKTPHRERPPIQKCLNRGQEILVQVLKEGIGTKGPTLTSYLSIPGRFLVMMPHMQRLGVTRKVEDDDARREARKLLGELNPPSDFGFIVRTAGIGQTKTDLKRDLSYLQRLWRNIDRTRKRIGKTGELYTESDLIIRTIRDVFSNDINRVIVDDPDAARRAYDFLNIASPRARSKVVYYDNHVPLFHRFNIEQQIDDIHSREVPLPSGGSLVIDQTEALVAIDVNSGKSRDARDAESNAFNTNKEAIDEICRQLRLRDLGGVIVLDLIDMRDRKNRRSIESKFRATIKNDRARTRTGSISQFGILELTRQRMRPSLKSSVYHPCDHCGGTGHVKTAESVVLDVMRRLALAMQHDNVTRVDLTISPDVAFQLLNRKRAQLAHLESRHQKQVTVRVGGHAIDYVRASAFDKRGGEIDIDTIVRGAKLTPEADTTYRELDGQPLPGESARPVDDELDLEPEETDDADQADAKDRDEKAGKSSKTRKRKSRSRSKAGADKDANQKPEEPKSEPKSEPKPEPKPEPAKDQAPDKPDKDEEEGEKTGKRRRRRRRGGRNRGKDQDKAPPEPSAQEETAEASEAAAEADIEPAEEQPAEPVAEPSAEQSADGGSERSRGRKKAGRRKKSATKARSDDKAPAETEADAASSADANGQASSDGDGGESGADGGRRRRRRRGGRRRNQSDQDDKPQSADESENGANAQPASAPDKTPVTVSSGYSNRLIKPKSQGESES